MPECSVNDVRCTLKRFQDGYAARDAGAIDEFMKLFAHDEGVEVIGTGASERSAREWFEGLRCIRNIIEGDWMYWGDVRLDVERAKISVRSDVAWLSTTGTVTRTRAFDEDIQYHLGDMKTLLDRENLSADEKLVEVTHYGVRRLRELARGVGYSRPITFTAVLVTEENMWRFHTIHWAMPME